MTPYHISLYLALFQQWNLERFADHFAISRSEMMQVSRIGSVNTYARCMKELEQWGYIRYAPSSNLHTGSRVACIRFDTATDTARNTESDTRISSSIENDTATNTAIDTGISSSIENDTATDTARDTGRSSGIESDTASDTARNTSSSSSIESETARNTARDTGSSTGIEKDTASDTGTSSRIKSETARNTASDTGSPTGIENDTARNTASDTGESTGITAGIKSDTASDTLLINIINKNKLNKERGENFDFSNEKEKTKNKFQNENSENPEENFHPPDFQEVEIFFRKNNYPITQSDKFYNHYQSVGWKLGGKTKIIDWQAAARKWMINTKNFEHNERKPNHVRTGQLGVNTNKDYSEPL